MGALKVLIGAVLCLVNTSLYVASKLSLVYLLSQFRNVRIQGWYASMSLVLLTPELFAFVKIIWCSNYLAKGEVSSWPSTRAMFMGILCAAVEAASITFFTLEVAPSLPAHVLLPLLSVVISIKLITQVWRKKRTFKVSQSCTDTGGQRTDKRTNCLRKTLLLGGGICCLSIAVVIACLFGVVSVTNIRQSVVMVAALFSLAFVWTPPIQLFTFRSADGRYVGRQRGCLVFTLVKVMCIGIFIICIIMMQTRGSLTTSASLIVEGYHMLPNMVILRWVLVNCLTGITAHLLSYCSAAYCLSHVGIALPSFLSTPIAIGVTIYSCLTGSFLYASASVCSSSEEIWIAFGLAILAWIIPFVALRHRYCKKTKILLTPMEETFLSYGWNNVFSDYHMSLSYRPEGFTPYDRCVLEEDNKKSRIFICTTMYHEADYEMERLLLSLQRLSLSTKLKDVYLEAHVVLDNGAKDCNLTEFALQLISLLQSKLEVDKMDSVAQQTPYGLQLHWILPGGMPFFIHLKDISKAKAKKRWSQILYMRYLMEHRIQKSSEWLQRQAEGLYDTPMYIGYSARDEADTARRQSKVSHHHHHNYEKALLSRIRSILTKSETTESLETLDAKDYLSALDSTEVTPSGSSILKRKGSLGSSDQGIDTGDEISSISTDEYPQSKNSSTKYTAGSNSLSVSSSSSVQEEFGHKNTAYEPDSMVENGANNEHGDSKNLGYVNIYEVMKSGIKPMKTPDNIIIPTISLTVDLEHQPPSLEYDDQTYILATDADMEFDDNSVKELLETCNRDLRLGGACGRTRPIGKTNGPIVWFQMFEYAKDFWMIKSAQNIIGSVMCCPGCFSLYRVNALKEVVTDYGRPTENASDVFTKDTGEDRWMCTLMMLRGWKLKYCTFGINTTYCPNTVDEFVKQRRRWVLSDLANTFLVFRNIFQLLRNNHCFTFMYIVYMLQLFIIILLSPGSTLIMLTAGMDMVFGISFVYFTPAVCGGLIIYAILCINVHSKLQTMITAVLMFALGVSMSCVVIGGVIFVVKDLIKDVSEDTLAFQEHYILILLMFSLVYAAVLHPHETWIIVHGISYMFMFPSMHILLPVYALCNIVDQSWGTRDNQKAKLPKLLCLPRLKRRRKNRKKKGKKGKKGEADKEDPDINDPSSYFLPMQDGNDAQVEEYNLWQKIMQTYIGVDVNLGLSKDAMAKGLLKVRLRAVIALLAANGVWVLLLSTLYMTATQQQTKINVYGVISGIVYGFSFTVQLIGMTVYRVQDTFQKLALWMSGDDYPIWIIRNRRNAKETQCASNGRK